MDRSSRSRLMVALVGASAVIALILFRLTPVGRREWTIEEANWLWLLLTFLLLWRIWRGSRPAWYALLVFHVLLLVFMVSGAAVPWSGQMWAVIALQLSLVALVALMAKGMSAGRRAVGSGV